MSSSRKNKTKHYLAMWDMLGLECLYDVDLHMNRNNEWDKKKIISILKEEKLPATYDITSKGE
jgi:hypothetical protein